MRLDKAQGVVMKKSTVLRNRLKKGGVLPAPGASTALLAKLVEMAGFEVVYATGAGIANMQFGVPDIGLATMSEVLETAKRMNDSVSVPVIADIDNGHGNALNTYRTAKEFTAAGIACLQLEDQVLPKRCGHFDGKAVVSTEEMVSKIKAAKDAMSIDPDALLIARTDAIAVNGIDDALERGARFLEAGADILFVEAPVSVDQMKLVTSTLKSWHVANMVEGGKTPLLTNSEMEKMGFNIVLYANAPLKAAVKGTKDLLSHLMHHGTSNNCDHLMISMKERNEITHLAEMRAQELRYKS